LKSRILNEFHELPIKISISILPLSRPHIPKGHREHANPINPFAHPTPRDRHVPYFEYEVNIEYVGKKSYDFNNQIDHCISRTGDGIEPHYRKGLKEQGGRHHS
jgi:hypothetical protein